MKKRSAFTYIERRDDGRPSQTLTQLCAELAGAAHFGEFDSHIPGLSNRPAKGRVKVRVTLTVERVP